MCESYNKYNIPIDIILLYVCVCVWGGKNITIKNLKLEYVCIILPI